MGRIRKHIFIQTEYTEIRSVIKKKNIIFYFVMYSYYLMANAISRFSFFFLLDQKEAKNHGKMRAW